MARKHLLLFVTLLFPILFYGQSASDTIKYYQLSGLIISSTTNEAVPYVRIQVNHSRRGEFTNGEGFYSIPVRKGDTLYFSHVGYYPSTFVVKDYIESYQGDVSQYLYAINYMLEDTLTLPTVNIFPYETPEEIKTAVLNMDFLDDSPEAVARQNLDPQVLHAIVQSLPVDGNERLQVGRQMYLDYYQTRNLAPTAALNPLAAMRLLQYVAQKSRKRKNKDLNYWE